MAVELAGSKFFVQPGSYLAGDPRLAIGVQGSVRGMLSGEGLFLLTVQGSGLLLLSSFGAIHAKTLAPGEEYIVDTGHIVAFEESVEYRLEKATGKTQGIGGFLKGMVQSALSGEGFVCRYRGPGRIYIQTRQLPGLRASSSRSCRRVRATDRGSGKDDVPHARPDPSPASDDPRRACRLFRR